MEIPRSLLSELEQQNIVLFVGSDFPQSLTGVPSRQELAKIIAEEKGIKTYHSLSEIAGYKETSQNRYQSTSLIIRNYSTSNLHPQPIHAHVVELIKKFKIATIVSLSYDELLYQELKSVGNCTFIVQNHDRRFVGNNRPLLINLFGTAKRPDTLLVNADDFQWTEERRVIFDLVKAEFYNHSVLFLGHQLYERADLDFLLKFDNPNDKFHQPNFSILDNCSNIEKDRWRQIRAEVIETSPTDFLERLAPLPVAHPIEIGVDKALQKQQRNLTQEDQEIPLESEKKTSTPTDETVFQAIEKELRMNKAHWNLPGFIPPQNEMNFTIAYLSQQLKGTHSVREKLENHHRNLRKMNLSSNYFFEVTNDILTIAGSQSKGLCQLLSSALNEVSTIRIYETANNVAKKAEKSRKTLVQFQLGTKGQNKLVQLETDLLALKLSLEQLEVQLQEMNRKASQYFISPN